MNRRKKSLIKKTSYFALAICGLIFILTNTAYAQDISLAWDPSPSSDVVGYKLYYQAASPTLPLAGSGAIEGNSPIDAGNGTGFSITGLPDGQIYYIAVTAYDAAGYESAYSNIVTSGWVPPLITPTNGSPAEQYTAETFNWETAPASYDVTYTLYYGTDSQLTVVTPPLVPEATDPHLQTVLIFSLLLLISLALVTSERTKPAIATGVLTLALGLSLAGCGGGGGSGESGVTPLPGSASTVVVEAGTSNYHVADLKPATTYYWKVVANDQTNAGLKYQSLTYTFTTAAN